MRRSESRALQSVDALICLTPAVRRALREVFDVRQPTLVLPSGVSLPKPVSEPGCERNIDVIYVGKVDARKGFSGLIDALVHLPGVRLCVVGGTPEQVDAQRALADRAGVADRIDFTGFVEPVQVSQFLARARVGVCPLPAGVSATSLEFSSPLKMLDMMAHGTPIVATRVPAVEAIATDGEHAVLVEPDDPVALATGIRSLLDDPDRGERMCAAALVRARDFTWSKRALRLHKFLTELD